MVVAPAVEVITWQYKRKRILEDSHSQVDNTYNIESEDPYTGKIKASK